MNLRRLAILSVLAFGSCDSLPDRAEIRRAWTPGESYTLTLEQESTGSLVRSESGKDTVIDLTRHERVVTRDEILAADAAGPSALKREIREWWIDGGGQPRKARALQGRTVTIKLGEDGLQVDGAGDAPASETKRLRLRVLGRLLQLPPGELAAGQDWTLDPDALEEAFGGGSGWNGIAVQDATGTGRLAAFEDGPEGPLARIRLDLAVEGPLVQLPDVRAQVGLEVDVRLRLSDGRPVSIAATGNGRLEGASSRAGGEAAYKGAFELKIRSMFE